MVAVAAAILVGSAIGAAGCGSGAAAPSTSEGPATTVGTAVKRGGKGEVASKLRTQVVHFGREGSRRELEDATVAIRAYFKAQADEDWAEICSLFASWLRSTASQIASGVREKGCAAGAKTMTLAGNADEESSVVDPRSLRRRGKRTFVIYTNGEGELMAMLMRPEGGEWKIAESKPNLLGAAP